MPKPEDWMEKIIREGLTPPQHGGNTWTTCPKEVADKIKGQLREMILSNKKQEHFTDNYGAFTEQFNRGYNQAKEDDVRLL